MTGGWPVIGLELSGLSIILRAVLLGLRVDGFMASIGMGDCVDWLDWYPQQSNDS